MQAQQKTAGLSHYDASEDSRHSCVPTHFGIHACARIPALAESPQQ